MNSYELAWTLYAVGGFGCGLAAWFLFRRFGREWGHFFMVTAWVLLLTPYAMEAEKMIMAPAIFILVMDGLVNGFETVKPITLLLLGVWLIALVLSLIFQLLTRAKAKKAEPQVSTNKRVSNTELSREEKQARDELLDSEIPLRAER